MTNPLNISCFKFMFFFLVVLSIYQFNRTAEFLNVENISAPIAHSWGVAIESFSGDSKNYKIDEVELVESLQGNSSANDTLNEYSQNGRDNVAIVTKVLWSKDLRRLSGWVCLMNRLYNHKKNHDFIVFTTMPWEDEEILTLQQIALPANLNVVLEGPPLEEQLEAMTPEELDFLLKRCNFNATEHPVLTWFHYCKEPNRTGVNNLGYCWQAEFRAYHIWTHPAIMTYEYMIWMDSDAYPGREWDVDPMEAMIDNDLTLMYAGWPYGTSVDREGEILRKIEHSYNTSICSIENKAEEGSGDVFLHASACETNVSNAAFNQIAGSHHITNLKVFRKDIHQKFLKDFVGDFRFRRSMDDQLAVTLVGFMDQYLTNNKSSDVPEKYTVWHERTQGIELDIMHHQCFDSIRSKKIGKRPFQYLSEKYPDIGEKCGAYF